MRKYNYFILLVVLLFAFPVQVHAEPRVQSTGDNLVIVIDPGHGGVNEGTTQNGFQEKTMTLVTAQAMYDELTQYDNVEVYMTRTDDVDLSLRERAEFAASVDADFLFSIHYNASENHTLFGSEIWISSVPPYNAYGYQFGYCYLSEMQDIGVVLRGIKTRLSETGTSDYYGVIRESVKLSVPAAILEHCHVDEPRDVEFCDTEEDWIAFGKADATAVAKYFGLSSTTLGVDYSEESLNLPAVKENVKVQNSVRDTTAPDVCSIELLEADYETGEISIQITATDYDSPLLYYDYSIDGGKSYSSMFPWPDTDLLAFTSPDVITLNLNIPSGVKPSIRVRVYNWADLRKFSNTLTVLQTFNYGEDAADDEIQAVSETGEMVYEQAPSVGTITFQPANAEINEADLSRRTEVSFVTFLKICLIIAMIVLFGFLVSQCITYKQRQKRYRQRRKELDEQNDQLR